MPWDRVPGQHFDALVGHADRRGRLRACDPPSIPELAAFICKENSPGSVSSPANLLQATEEDHDAQSTHPLTGVGHDGGSADAAGASRSCNTNNLPVEPFWCTGGASRHSRRDGFCNGSTWSDGPNTTNQRNV